MLGEKGVSTRITPALASARARVRERERGSESAHSLAQPARRVLRAGAAAVEGRTLYVSTGNMSRCSATPAHDPAIMCCRNDTPRPGSNSSHSSCASTASGSDDAAIVTMGRVGHDELPLGLWLSLVVHQFRAELVERRTHSFRRPLFCRNSGGAFFGAFSIARILGQIENVRTKV